MKQYELTYLISPELKTEEAEGFALEVSNSLQNEGGSIIKTEGPKPKTLSYQIKKQGSAFQVGLEFSASPEKLKTFEERLKKDPKILRYLIVVKKPPQRERERREIKTDILQEERPSIAKTSEDKVEKKVELKDIEEKLEEILKE